MVAASGRPVLALRPSGCRIVKEHRPRLAAFPRRRSISRPHFNRSQAAILVPHAEPYAPLAKSLVKVQAWVKLAHVKEHVTAAVVATDKAEAAI
jgi:hypothetical protein